MVPCEICGRVAPRKTMSHILVDGAVLEVCPVCSAFGERVAPPKPKPIVRRGTGTVDRSPPIKPRPEELLGVVDDYASRVVQGREMSGLSREELARIINEKESVIKNVEANRLVPPVPLARKMEKVLKVSLVVPPVGVDEKQAARPTGREEELTFGDVVKIRKKM